MELDDFEVDPDYWNLVGDDPTTEARPPLVKSVAGCQLAYRGRGAKSACDRRFVWLHEEPELRRRFGAEYDAYRRAVPA